MSNGAFLTLIPPIENGCRYLNSVFYVLPCLMMLHNICNLLQWKKWDFCVVHRGLIQLIYACSYVWTVNSDWWANGLATTFWSTMDSTMFVSLNFEWRENRLHLVTLTHSNIFKSKKPHPLCLCFLIRFSEEEAEATEDFHMSISCLFKNKITVGNSQLFNIFFQNS